MDHTKLISKIIFSFTIILILSSCTYLPRDQFDVISKNELDEYYINNVVVQFHLILDIIWLNEEERNEENLAKNGWALNIYRKEGSNVSYRVNKIMIKTSDYEIDLEDVLYENNSYKNRAESPIFRSLTIPDQHNFRKKETFIVLRDSHYEISGIRSHIMYPLPKDKKVNIVVDIDIINDNGCENGIFMYSFEIKKRRVLFYMYA
jgi:hypothetical protein